MRNREKETKMLWLKCSFQHLDIKRSPVRRNVVQHFTFVFSLCRLGFRPPELTKFGLLPGERKRGGGEQERSARTWPLQSPRLLSLHCLLLPQKWLHNCKEPEQFVCFSFSKLPTSLSCFQFHDVFPHGQGSTESLSVKPALSTHKPIEIFNKEIPHQSGFIQHYSNDSMEPSQIIL